MDSLFRKVTQTLGQLKSSMVDLRELLFLQVWSILSTQYRVNTKEGVGSVNNLKFLHLLNSLLHGLVSNMVKMGIFWEIKNHKLLEEVAWDVWDVQTTNQGTLRENVNRELVQIHYTLSLRMVRNKEIVRNVMAKAMLIVQRRAVYHVPNIKYPILVMAQFDVSNLLVKAIKESL